MFNNSPGDYHLNINMQMSYWAADTAGAREVMGPLLGFITGMLTSSSLCHHVLPTSDLFPPSLALSSLALRFYVPSNPTLFRLYFCCLFCVTQLFVRSDLSRSGTRTAKNTYGVQSGWVAHGFTDNRLGCGMIGKIIK